MSAYPANDASIFDDFRRWVFPLPGFLWAILMGVRVPPEKGYESGFFQTLRAMRHHSEIRYIAASFIMGDTSPDELFAPLLKPGLVEISPGFDGRLESFEVASRVLLIHLKMFILFGIMTGQQFDFIGPACIRLPVIVAIV